MDEDTSARGHGSAAPAPRKKGVLFWLLLAAGALVFLCCLSGGALYLFGRDWIDIATAPPGEREKLLSQKLEAMADDEMKTIDSYLTAVNEERDDDAWAMATEGFRSSTTREQFGELTVLVRRVMGRSTERHLTNFNTRMVAGGPSVCTLTLNATFERGAGTISFELQKAGSGWLVHSWRTNSPRFLDAMKQGAPK